MRKKAAQWHPAFFKASDMEISRRTGSPVLNLLARLVSAKFIITQAVLFFLLVTSHSGYAQSIPYPQFVDTGNPEQDSAVYNTALNQYQAWKLGQTTPESRTGVRRNAAVIRGNETQAVLAANCIIPRDNTWIAVPTNDDGFLGPINLGFTFNLYGSAYNQVYINTNGNLTFTQGYSPFTPTGFPFNIPMVAAFWADEDTRPECGGPGTGIIYYKLEPTRLLVTWENVGYFNLHCDKTVTFQIVIGTQTDPIISASGTGNNVLFNYGDMNWTTGDASSGVGGFGGAPATVGANKGDGTSYVQVGRFDHPGTDYDGPGGATDGVDYLDNKCFAFNVTGTTSNIPPSFSGLPAGNVINLILGQTASYTIQAIGPEVGQTVTTTVNTNGVCGVTSSITNGAVSTTNLSVTGSSCNAGSNTITLTATDNGTPIGITTVMLTINVTGGPPPTIFYSKATGDLHNPLTWGSNPDGTGISPANFDAGQTFNLGNRGSVYALTGDWTVRGILNIPAGSQLQISGYTLSIADVIGLGTITGSVTCRLITLPSVNPATLYFTPNINTLNSLTVSTGANTILGTALNLLGVLTINGTLNTSDMLTLRSTAIGTCRVEPVTGVINGLVTCERYLPARRAWRILSAPVGGIATGAAVGQAALTHSQEPGATPLTTSTGALRPLSYGTANFSLNAAQTAMTMTATIYNIDVTGSQTPDANDNLLNAHIHVGAPLGANAAVRWGFFGSPDNDISPKQLVITPFAGGGVGGTFTSTWDVNEGNASTTLTTNLPGILAGLSYINFHTTQFAGGEIRGQITLVGAGTQTINAAWQEGVILGSSANPNPFPGYGTHITGGMLYGSVANGFDQNPVAGAMSSIKRYNGIINNWEEVPNTNATYVGSDAFMTFIRGDRGIPLSYNTVPPTATTLRAKGPLKVGDQVFQVSGNGFTAVPNPFASPINFATLTRSGVQNNFYVWDPKMGGVDGVGAYVLLSDNGLGGYTITPAPVSPESQYIQSGQGFLVRPTVAGTPGSVTIKESDKSATAATDVFRTSGGAVANAPRFVDPASGAGWRITLKAAAANGSAPVLDEVLLSYHSMYKATLDDLDAVKMENIQENLGTVHDDQVLMVERKPLPQTNDTVTLKLWNIKAQAYMLEVNPVNLSGTGLSAWLEDKYLKTFTPVSLAEKQQVPFAVTGDAASARTDRFRIVLTVKKPLGDVVNTELGKAVITAYPNPISGRQITLWFNNQEAGTYQVSLLNSIGQVVFRTNVQHGGGSATQVVELDKKPRAGVYQLQVSSRTEKTNIKMVSN